jgi:hypothetical protein
MAGGRTPLTGPRNANQKGCQRRPRLQERFLCIDAADAAPRYDRYLRHKHPRQGRPPRAASKRPRTCRLRKGARSVEAWSLAGICVRHRCDLRRIQRADRAKVFGSTSLARSHEETRTADGAVVHHVTLETTQPARPALHPENARRFQAALSLGFRALCVEPRIGLPRIDDPDKRIYLYENDDAKLRARLDRTFEAARAIEARGFGMGPIQKIAARLANRAGVTEPWYSSLDRANSSEEVEIAKAIAEWADGDTVAAHIGFQIEYLCTGDKGAKAGNSIFDPTQRAWLAATYGVQFLTISELAAMVA